MGACSSVAPAKRIPNSDVISMSNLSRNGRTINPHSTISGIKRQVVIKHINDLNGDAAKIDKCEDSTIIIMDNSAQVIINECTNCNFFIAPCKGSIFLRKSTNINIISASAQFRSSDVTNCKASLYVNSQPALEKVSNFQLGCFFFMYTELPELFYKTEMKVWDNFWSEYNDFTPSNESNITYFNPKEDKEFIQSFSAALKDQEISIDQYFPVPFTYGLSKINYNKSCRHLVFLFKESYVDSNKTYELLNDELLDSFNCSLLKTSFLENGSAFITDLSAKLDRKNNTKKLEFFQTIKSNSFKKHKKESSGIISKQYSNFNNSNGFVMLWLINNNDNFFEFIQMVDNEFENCLYVTNEDVDNLESLLKVFFKNFEI